jgi:hypothetical protein
MLVSLEARSSAAPGLTAVGENAQGWNTSGGCSMLVEYHDHPGPPVCWIETYVCWDGGTLFSTTATETFPLTVLVPVPLVVPLPA